MEFSGVNRSGLNSYSFEMTKKLVHVFCLPEGSPKHRVDCESHMFE